MRACLMRGDRGLARAASFCSNAEAASPQLASTQKAKPMLKQISAAVFTTFLCLSLAHAENNCEAQAKDKKLSGAAKMSFVAKCERTAAEPAATAAAEECGKQAVAKKLAGAAKTSFIKKCTKDSTAK
jgi:hypothetical protein